MKSAKNVFGHLAQEVETGKIAGFFVCAVNTSGQITSASSISPEILNMPMIAAMNLNVDLLKADVMQAFLASQAAAAKEQHDEAIKQASQKAARPNIIMPGRS